LAEHGKWNASALAKQKSLSAKSASEWRCSGRNSQSRASLDGGAWILIEKRDDLSFVRGQSKRASLEATLAATGVDSANIAIKGAEAWAGLLMAAVIYVRDDR
jgi:hypothetical protein